MVRIKKDGRNINCNILRESYEQLEMICEITGQSKTVALERAISLYAKYITDKENYDYLSDKVTKDTKNKWNDLHIYNKNRKEAELSLYNAKTA